MTIGNSNDSIDAMRTSRSDSTKLLTLSAASVASSSSEHVEQQSLVASLSADSNSSSSLDSDERVVDIVFDDANSSIRVVDFDAVSNDSVILLARIVSLNSD